MSKNIETLVDDIYKLFEANEEKFDLELFEEFGGNLRDSMDYRFHSEAREATLRMSNIGKPDRQLWFDLNWKGDKEHFTPQTLIKFSYGDVLEQMMILYAKMAGHEVKEEQGEIEVNGIKGHIDCLIDGCVVDVKSASTFSFKKFESGSLLEPGNDPFGYVGQLAGYVEAKTPGKDGYFLAVDKTLGKICLLKVPASHLQQYQVKDRIDYVKEMVEGEEVPGRCYDDKTEGKSGNRKLDTGCSYCAHKFHCWSDSNSGAGLRTFYYSSGPVYLTEVVREPRVSEFPSEF